MIGVINRTQGPIIRLVETFSISELSHYCHPLNSISNVYKRYQNFKKGVKSINSQLQYKPQKKNLNEQEVKQRLANVAMEFISLSITSNCSNAGKPKEEMLLKGVIYERDESTQVTVNFDVKKFYQFIRFDMNNANVGKMLQLMYEYMGTNYEKKGTRGSNNSLQKVKSFE